MGQSYYDSLSLHRPISYYILVSFGWTDQSPWSGLRQKGTILFAFLRWPLSLWPREQALKSQMVRGELPVNSDPGQDWAEFFRVIRWYFAYVKREKIIMIMRGCGSSYQCCESVWLCDFRMVLTGMWSRGWTTVLPKYSVPAINIVSSVFSLLHCTLKKQLSTQENWIKV